MLYLVLIGQGSHREWLANPDREDHSLCAMLRTTDKHTPPPQMLISEAMVMLAPYGVERIERIASQDCPVWRVTQNGAEYIYAAELDRVVWALGVANDWEQ